MPRHRSATSNEGRLLAAEHAAALAELPLRQLDSYGSRRETLRAVSGKRYVVRSVAYWDAEPWESGLYIIVKVRPTKGWWRRIWPYRAVVVRPPPT